ncbi:MAG: spore germination protein [Caulobacteraceae bacterium]
MPSNDKKNKPENDQKPEENNGYKDLEVTTQNLKTILGINTDVIFREVLIRNREDLKVSFIFVDGLVDSKSASDYILKPLMQEERFDLCMTYDEAMKLLEHGVVYNAAMKKREKMEDLLTDLLTGSTVIVFDSEKTAFSFEVKGFDKRGIDEPTGENVIKGAKDSFIEVIRTNTATCRRKIKSPDLVIKEMVVGKQSKTPVALVYLKGIANKKLVDEVKKRLDSINIDRAITSGYIEEFIIDDKYSAFPQVMSTERPDRFCSNISDGRVGLIIDGLPTAFIIPGTLLQFIQAPEDYSQHFLVSSVIRFIRFISMAITLVLPGFYVSATTFHQEMLPTELAFSIVASKEGVPFPMFVEVFLLLIAFELLVEAGLRLPKTIGQTVSIVGALVVGQSAVQAKLVSPATVVIIAVTAIASFTMPNQDLSNALRLWRFGITVLSSIIGIFGMTLGLVLLLYHWCKLETFGVPYLDPLVASEDLQLQDTLFRFPLFTMIKRPKELNPYNKKRME